MTKLKSELVREKSWYPPTCKPHVELLNDYCSNRTYDRRDKLDVLTDIEYRAVAEDASGVVRGFKHDRLKGVLKLNIEDSDTKERESVDLIDIVKFERIGEVPTKYQKTR